MRRSDRRGAYAVPVGLFMRLNDTRRSGGLADLVDGLRAIVEPSARHTVAEREAQRQRRDDADAPDRPYGPVDLDSGRVRVHRARADRADPAQRPPD